MTHTEKSMDDTVKKTVKIIGNVLTVASLIFVFSRLKNYDIDYSILTSGNNLAALLCMSAAYSLNLLATPVSWKLILNMFGYSQVKFTDTQSVFCKSNLMKYIPGNVMQYIGRNEIAVRYDLDHANVALSTVLDVGANVIGVGCVALLCYKDGVYMFLNQYNIPDFVIAIALIIAIVVLITALVFISRKVGLEWTEYCRLLPCIGLYAVLAMYTATIYVIIIKYMLKTDIYAGGTLMVMGSYLLSWILGFLIPGAPGGIGIREAAITLFLGKYMSNDVILLAIVIYRIINTIGDVLAYVCCLIIGWCADATNRNYRFRDRL